MAGLAELALAVNARSGGRRAPNPWGVGRTASDPSDHAAHRAGKAAESLKW
jgi:hypothetical protein